MELDAVLPNNLSHINNAVLSNHSNQLKSLADQPGIDEEINYPIAASNSSQPTPINLDSGGLRPSSRTEVLNRCGLVYSDTTLMDHDERLTSPQTAHLCLASQRIFSSAHVLFSNICPFGGLSCWVQSLVVKVQVSSTPTVSRHAFALLAFEPVTSTNQINQDKSSATFKLVAASVSNNNALSFNDKSSSTFMLVVASITNEFLKGQTIDSPAKQRPVPNDDPAIESSLQLQVPMIIASIRQLIVALTFDRSIEALPIFQLIDVSVPDKNDSCSVFQMVAHEHNTFIESTSFNDGFFQLIVKLILILISEGAQLASATLQTFTEGDQAAPQNANLQTTNHFQQGATSHFYNNHLRRLIVEYQTKISLHFVKYFTITVLPTEQELIPEY
jgi:hypothetical protein